MTIIKIVAKEIDQSHTDPAHIKLRHTCALHMGLVSKKNASCIWGYNGFYPNAKGEPRDILQPLLSLCVTLMYL